MVEGENEQVRFDGHPSEMFPVKPLGAEALMGKVVEPFPTTIVDVEADEERVKTAMPVPERATVCGLPLASSSIFKVPFRAPVAVG